jgi:hypothetical protein
MRRHTASGTEKLFMTVRRGHETVNTVHEAASQSYLEVIAPTRKDSVILQPRNDRPMLLRCSPELV